MLLCLVFLCHYVNAQEAWSKEKITRNIYNAYYWDSDKEQCIYEKIEKLCLELLEEDSLNFVGNYYLGMLYYNEGVYINNSSENLTEKDEAKARAFIKKSEKYFARVKKYNLKPKSD